LCAIGDYSAAVNEGSGEFVVKHSGFRRKATIRLDQNNSAAAFTDSEIQSR